MILLKIISFKSYIFVLVLFSLSIIKIHAHNKKQQSEDQTLPPGVTVFGPAIELPGVDINCFRIPSVIQTAKCLIAFSEAREGRCSDCVRNGIVMRRSFDGGRTWDKAKWAVNDSATDGSKRSGMDIGGNPTALYIPESNTVILQFVRGESHRKVQAQPCNPALSNWQMMSQNDGDSWSAPVEISSALGPWAGSLVGPGTGIRLRTAREKGRLLFCGHWGVYNSTQVWYSDDNGITYKLSKTIFPYMDESQLVELNNGSVMINMRNNHKDSCKCRGISVSNDGGKTFGPIQYDPTLISPICQASIANIGGHLYFSNPASKFFRLNMTIRHSDNDGQSWSSNTDLIFTGSSDYSCLVPDPLHDNPTQGGLLWGSKLSNGSWTVQFTRFNLSHKKYDILHL